MGASSGRVGAGLLGCTLRPATALFVNPTTNTTHDENDARSVLDPSAMVTFLLDAIEVDVCYLRPRLTQRAPKTPFPPSAPRGRQRDGAGTAGPRVRRGAYAG